MNGDCLPLFPQPRNVQSGNEKSCWPIQLSLAPLPEIFAALRPALAELSTHLSTTAPHTSWHLDRASELGIESNCRLEINHRPDLSEQAYQLVLNTSGIFISASTPSGAFFALQTLKQIVHLFPETYPHLEIDDAPDLKTRGYMLDISRCKVPRQDTLFALIDQLASLKFNQLQLYIEHTFAFPGHDVVWGDASALTADDIRALDQYCSERFIELVPNFNSFGHWERWLRHDSYHRFAECPYGWRRPDGHGMPWSSTLHPSEDSLNLIQSLYADYLPNFSSQRFNLGGDEPWELGMGRSRDRCEREGKYKVYVDFLNQIAEAAAGYSSEIQFWADIVLEKPESVKSLHPKLSALVWGYESNHPFEEQASTFAESRIPFYLCPGTSSWLSLGTRLENAIDNIRMAAHEAKKHGAEGILLTDWGDCGHHQPAILSLPAIFHSAQSAWNTSASDENLDTALAKWSLDLKDPRLVSIVRNIGTLNNTLEFRPPNRSGLINLLTVKADRASEAAKAFSEQELRTIVHRCDEMIDGISTLPPSNDSSQISHKELLVVLWMIRHAAQRGLHLKSVSDAWSRSQLRNDLTSIIGHFEECWIIRNRIGGLHESSNWLRQTLEAYREPRPSWPPSPD